MIVPYEKCIQYRNLVGKSEDHLQDTGIAVWGIILTFI
jgi:hypothetical protein